MKTLIAYATKHGAAKIIAEKIAEQIEGAELCDLQEIPMPAVEAYDCVVIGGSLYAGRVCEAARAFAAKQEASLRGKTIGLFVSGLAETGIEKYFQSNFPAAIVEKAKEKAFLGGVYDPAKCNFGEKLILKLLGKKGYVSTISDEKIAAFVKGMSA